VAIASNRRRFARVALSSAATLLSLLAACPLPPGPEPTGPVSFELVNDTDLFVDANFFRSSSAGSAAELFVQPNIYTGYSSKPIPTLDPRQTVSFSLECEEVAALGVRRPVATSLVTFTGTESADEILLLRGSDYACEDHIRFVYYFDGAAFRVRVE